MSWLFCFYLLAFYLSPIILHLSLRHARPNFKRLPSFFIKNAKSCLYAYKVSWCGEAVGRLMSFIKTLKLILI